MAEQEMSMEEVLSSIRTILATESKIGDKAAAKRPFDRFGKQETSEVLDLKDVVKKPKQSTQEPKGISPTLKAGGQGSAVLSIDREAVKGHDLASKIAQQERLTGGLEGFLLASLQKIMGDYFETWAKEHIPQMAERVLKEQIRTIFQSYEKKP